MNLLLDLITSHQLRLLLVDSLSDLTRDLSVLRHFNGELERLQQLLQGTACALLFIDEPAPPGCVGSIWTAVGRYVSEQPCISNCAEKSG